MSQASGAAVCTLFTRNHLPRGRVLQQSLHALHPEMELFMLVTDLPGQVDQSGMPERTTLLGAEDVMAASDVARISALYNPLEYCAAFKPALIAHLLERGYDKVVYLDSDILLLNPLDEILDQLEEPAVLLTPHLHRPARGEGKEQAELEILLAGTFNTGFVGASKGGDTDAFLAWWRARLRTHGFDDRPAGMFSDQKWVDLAPTLFENVRILRHPGCNVGYWNLNFREVERSEGRWTIDGNDLVFFHFSAFDPEQPALISRWYKPAGPISPALAGLASHYAAALKAADEDRVSETRYPFDRFSNGVPFTWLCRHLLRRAPQLFDQFPRPLDVAEPSFFEWLRAPSWYEPAQRNVSFYVQALHASEVGPPGASRSVEPDPNRWQQWLASKRPDVPAAFLNF